MLCQSLSPSTGLLVYVHSSAFPVKAEMPIYIDGSWLQAPIREYWRAGAAEVRVNREGVVVEVATAKVYRPLLQTALQAKHLAAWIAAAYAHQEGSSQRVVKSDCRAVVKAHASRRWAMRHQAPHAEAIRHFAVSAAVLGR